MAATARTATDNADMVSTPKHPAARFCPSNPGLRVIATPNGHLYRVIARLARRKKFAPPPGGSVLAAITSLVEFCPFVDETPVCTVIPETTFFKLLVEQWHVERGATSSITEMAMCRSYLRIIGMGRSAIPLILRQMNEEGDGSDMWFVGDLSL